MNTPAEAHGLVLGLRDFFLAEHAGGLAAAYARLAASAPVPPVPSLSESPTFWDETEFAFNRLFVGPGPLIAPPYSSVYLDSEPVLMGASTLLVREVHRVLGLETAHRGSVPDDHLAVELETALALRILAGSGLSHAERWQDLTALRRAFLARHMALWIPRFADRVLGDRTATGPNITAIRTLETWLRHELASLPPEGDTLATAPTMHPESATRGEPV